MKSYSFHSHGAGSLWTSALLLLVLLLLPSPQLNAEPLRDIAQQIPFVEALDASLESRQYFDVSRDGPEEEYYENRNDLSLGAVLRFTDTLSARISGHQYFHYGRDDGGYHPEQTHARLWEAYVDYEFESLSIRVGQQTIRWGKGDEINPTDVFTQENFREFINRDRAERKMPTPAVSADYYVSDEVKLSTVWVPFFEENLFAGTNQDWEFFFRREYRRVFGLDDIPEQTPSNSLNNSSAAAKLAFERGWGDFSLMYAYHYDQNLNYRVTTNPQLVDPQTGPVVAQWERLHTLGADIEMDVDGFGLRAEAAYTLDKPSVTLDLADDDLIARNDTLITVLGLDYQFSNATYVNIQLVQEILRHRQSQQYYKSYESSYTWRVRRDFFRERLRLEFTGRAFLTQRDWFFHVGGTYEVIEGGRASIEYHHFDGSEDRLFGQFDDNDQILLGFKYEI